MPLLSVICSVVDVCTIKYGVVLMDCSNETKKRPVGGLVALSKFIYSLSSLYRPKYWLVEDALAILLGLRCIFIVLLGLT